MKTTGVPVLPTEWREIEFLIRRSGRSLSNVLIMGESNSVRLVIASSFHNGGKTAGMAFLAADCRCFVNEIGKRLVDGFTLGEPAHSGRSSLTLVIPGTTFLDGVDGLSTDEQRLLLEFVKETERQRFLSGKCSVGRLIVGSETNLWALCRSGRFVPELYDCLNKVKVDLTPRETLRIVG